MRYLFRLMCVCALGVVPLGGCGETAGNGGTGGTGGTILCEGDFECDDENECTTELCDLADGMCAYSNEPKSTPCDGDGVCDGAGTCVECNDDKQCDNFNDCTTDTCDSENGVCNDPTPVADGTECAEGTCQAGACALSGTVLPCTEQGIRNAIVAGGGPYTFDCEGPTTVRTEAEIVIDNDVILDGEGELRVHGKNDHRVFYVSGTVELRGLTVSGGRTVGEGGGGIFNEGDLTVVNSKVRDNAAVGRQGGGGLLNSDQGTLTLTDSTVSGNDGDGINNEGTCVVADSIVADNDVTGIANEGMMMLTDTIVSGINYIDPDFNGGINNRGSLTMTGVTVTGTSGVFNTGVLTMMNSTVSGNISPGDSGGSGAVFNAFKGPSFETGTLTIINSTVSGNTTPSPVGGGIFSEGSEGEFQVTITNSTVSGNIPNEIFGEAIVTNTLIDGDCGSGTGIMSNGHNLESPGNTCGFDQTSDQSGVTAEQLNLGPLADNGGATMTHALLPGSVAIDVIPVAMCEVDEDQRGVTRPQGPTCDVGAFELEVAP